MVRWKRIGNTGQKLIRNPRGQGNHGDRFGGFGGDRFGGSLRGTFVGKIRDGSLTFAS